MAKNFQPGLMNIVAKVMKPNGILVGLFPLIEIMDSAFSGSYYFDLSTSLSDPEGEYLISIREPTSGVKDITKVSLQSPSSGGGSSQDKTVHVTGRLYQTGVIKGRILAANIQGVVTSSTITC